MQKRLRELEVLQRGAAVKVNRVEDLPFGLEQLLGSKKLAEMAQAATALGRPAAAANICRAVIERVVAQALDGEAAVDFEPSGLTWTLNIPDRHILSQG